MARYGSGWRAPKEGSAPTAPFKSQGPREEPYGQEEDIDTDTFGNNTRMLIGSFYEEDIDADTYGNETRVLVGTEAAFQRPWHKDKRWWVRWPAQVWQVTGQRFVRRVSISCNSVHII